MPAGITAAGTRPDIMVQMVASGRGVAALPRWLVLEYADKMDVVPVKLGRYGIAKQIRLGEREGDLSSDYLRAFMAFARQSASLSTAVDASRDHQPSSGVAFFRRIPSRLAYQPLALLKGYSYSGTGSNG